MSCTAKAGKHKTRQCRNPGHPLLAGVGIERCEVHGRLEGLLSGDPAALTHKALHGGEQIDRGGGGTGGDSPQGEPVPPSLQDVPAAPPPPPEPEPIELPPELQLFPDAPPIEQEPGASPAAAPAADLDALEALAAGMLRDVPDDPQEADAAAAAAAPAAGAVSGPAAAAGLIEGGAWDVERSERLTRFLCGQLFKVTGKQPLDDDELREGAEALLPVYADVFKSESTPRYMPAILWALFVLGPRYAGDVRAKLGARRAARRPAAAAPQPAAEQRERDDPQPDPDDPAARPRGWAAVARVS